MLKRIQCDEFKTFEGAVRPPIEFHKGLNAVIGNESGTNSVGKSTFLMILDFVFGGDDYIRKSKEVHKNILPHQICLLIDEIGKINEFSYPLMLKTLNRVVVNANGKLTFIFQSGIKITV